MSSAFGLAGMRERVSLAGGTLSLDSGERGTSLSACLPARYRPPIGERALASAKQTANR
jgi:glucose-6-phosphate-specific signal transduction histidine kinase